MHLLKEGIISEIIVAPDMTIISGHQRYKTAKELGLKMVSIRIREDLIDEDKKLKVLLAANFSRPKNDEANQRKVAAEYVRLCGYEHGGSRNSSGQLDHLEILSEIATKFGMSEKSLRRAISIENNLTEPMKELLDTGVISKTLATDVIAGLRIRINKVIVSGHQCVRACKELGIKTVMCDVHTYDNEDKILFASGRSFI